jgi:integrase/recombinase XerC
MKIRVVSHETEAAIREYLDPDTDMAVSIALSTALRVSEICSIKAEDINRHDPDVPEPRWTVNVKVKGRGRYRKVYLGALARKIERYLDGRTTGRLVEGANRQRLWRHWRRAQEKAGVVPHYRFHDLRHTACDRHNRKYNDLRLTQLLAGHANVSTTALYTHPTLKDVAETMEGDS